MDEDSSSEEESEQDNEVDLANTTRKGGLYLGNRTNIQKMLNSLEQLM